MHSMSVFEEITNFMGININIYNNPMDEETV
jgi:hypothetical protein